MPRVPVVSGEPTPEEIINAFAGNLEDNESLLERVEIRRVSNLEYVGRFYYSEDDEFDGNVRMWTLS